MSTFRYTKLNTRNDEIRLLLLLPADHNTGDLDLHMMHVPFGRAKKLNYNALSYTWGSEAILHNIHIRHCPRHGLFTRIRHAWKDVVDFETVNPGVLSITQNLAYALRSLRQPVEPLLLWIDAICIDQKNDAEKSSEVSRMGDIYRSAGSVLVWLGLRSENSNLAMHTIGAVVSSVKSLGAGSSWQYVENRRDSPYFWETFSEQERNVRRAAVLNLLQRPWFTRLWIWQEIILSTNAIMICGSEKLRYEDFRTAILMAVGEVQFGEPLHDLLDTRTREAMLRMVKMPRQSPNFPALIDFTKYAQCKDPRDRVYGLKSLMVLELQAEVKPDYCKTAEEIFKLATLSSIKVERNLEILTCCEMPFPLEWQRSWVPNLGSPKRRKSINFGHAAGWSEPEVILDENGGLMANGVQAATISNILCVFSIEASEAEMIQTIQKLFLDLAPESLTQAELLPWAISCIALGTCVGSATEYIDRRASETPEAHREGFNLFVNSDLSNTPILSFSNIPLVASAVRIFPGNAIFKTGEGYIGIGPAATEVGDHICCLLGCNVPLIFRRATRSVDNYTLVGASFVRNFMDKEAFLGPLPGGVLSWCAIDNNHLRIMYLHNGVASEADPRLGNLPPSWKADTKDVYEGISTSQYAPGFEKFPSKRTLIDRSKKNFYDPRMSSKMLMYRGVDIKTFIII